MRKAFHMEAIMAEDKFHLGLFLGKFLPPHLGHKWAILDASKKCEKLILLVCYEPHITEVECKKAGIPILTLEQKVAWWREELVDCANIEVRALDETGLPLFPEGWGPWADAVKRVIPEHIDVIFGSEPGYGEGYKKYFVGTQYLLQDTARHNVTISSTIIRSDIKKYIDYIIPSARPFFEKIYK